MPYINQTQRKELAAIFNFDNFYFTQGQLNHIITKLCLATEPRDYEDLNGIVGVLECVKLEFYRRAVAAYEDKKIKENGDVY